MKAVEIVQKRRRNIDDRRAVSSFFSRVVVLSIMIVSIFSLVLGISKMPDNTMKPGISGGDLLLYYRLIPDYYHGDVVTYEHEGKMMVGRVIVGPENSIDIKDGIIHVNGSELLEEYSYSTTYPYEEGVGFPVKTGQEEYFILGDNREYAEDSRIVGPVSKDSIKGKVITVLKRSDI